MITVICVSEFPLVAITCLPPSNPKSDSLSEGVLNPFDILINSCTVTLSDLRNEKDKLDLGTIAVLTSKPELLSVTEVSTATNVLSNYLERSNNEVS